MAIKTRKSRTSTRTHAFERPSAELVAEIRRLFASGSVLNIGEQRALIRELDAVTRERDEYPALIAKREERHRYELDFAHRERDEARKVTDEMVERAARGMFEGAQWGFDWKQIDNTTKDMYRVSARRALTAALGGTA